MNILYYVPKHIESEKAGSFVRERMRRLGLEIELCRVEQTDMERVKKEKNIPDFPCLITDDGTYIRLGEIKKCPLLYREVKIPDDPNKKYLFKQQGFNFKHPK